MVAARMAVPFLQEVELGKRPKLPKSIKRQSLNEMAAFVAGEAGQSEPQMSKAGSGGRALRVVHLAVAALIIGSYHVHGGGTTTMETMDLGLFSIRAVVVKRFQANNSNFCRSRARASLRDQPLALPAWDRGAPFVSGLQAS